MKNKLIKEKGKQGMSRYLKRSDLSDIDLKGLTLSSVIKNKKVIHNGVLGLNQDLTPVTQETLEATKEDLHIAKEMLLSHTEHYIYEQPFGIIVATEVGKNKEVAFVGYDERSTSNVNLGYATDTFLAMEIVSLVGRLDAKAGIKNVDESITEEDKVEQAISEYTSKEEATTARELMTREDYKGVNFGKDSDDMDGVYNFMVEKIEKVKNSLVKQGVLTEGKEEMAFAKDLRGFLNNYVDKLTFSPVLEKGTEFYTLMFDIMTRLSEAIPNTRIVDNEYNILWVKVNGETIISIYDKTAFEEEGIEGGMGIIVENNTPSYTVIRKLLDFLSSNVGYKKLMKSNNKLVKQLGELPKKNKPSNKVVDTKGKQLVNEEETTEEVEEDNTKSTIPLTKSDYFDIYMPVAGGWASSGNKFKEIKTILQTIAENRDDIDGISIRGISNTDMIIDWVVNKETHTMALTSKATLVDELGVSYDTVIAYDTNYVHILEALIEDKIAEVTKIA